MILHTLALLVSAASAAPAHGHGDDPDAARWARRARAVTIVRDDWGIAHVRAKTDADVVFGAMYAQAEDDFNRIELNYINAMGRLAEAEGESAIWQDLRMKLFIDPDSMKAMYRRSPAWLRQLMIGFADGLNYYLARHPEVHPRVITRFEPWMALTFSEGSIGGDIERVSLNQLEAFYGGARRTDVPPDPDPSGDGQPITADREPRGSNGIAIAPSNTTSHHALLLINPHTSFFFRSELQMTSDEGLNAYGAATWGQFFIYQGFNDRVGWMHTSSGADFIDEFLETVVKRNGRYYYRTGTSLRPVATRTVTIPYRTASGMASRTFTVFRTHHGPIVRSVGGRWTAVALMEAPLKALTQSYTRTKARDYKSFRQIMELHTNSSNNTIFASAGGDIAYFHSNFIPRRDPKFDWTRPVEGTDPATEWKGLLSVDSTPQVHNPESGWLYNSNDWPWAAAGPSSPKRADYPRYVETGGESARGRHAVLVLQARKDFTLDGLVAAAYDSYLPWFERPLPALIRAWDSLPTANPIKSQLSEQIGLLRSWDMRWSVASVPTSLGVLWGESASRLVAADARAAGIGIEEYIGTRAPSELLLRALVAASERLVADFGRWRTPWGEINRFQRLTDDIQHPFDDAQPSIPVGFTSATWGSLASYGAQPTARTKKRYGTNGNSFVAVVEFGDSVRARAVTAGGESGDPKSLHFNDQAERYSTGNLRDVYFYPAQLVGHTERTYHPGS